VKAHEYHYGSSSFPVWYMIQDTLCNPAAKLSHSIAISCCAHEVLCYPPATHFSNMAVECQIVQHFHGLLECLASLQELGLVGIVRQEDLAVGDVLVDLVLGMRCFRMLCTSDEMTKAEEVSDVFGHHWDGKTIDGLATK
jgi:hypothetical protein